MSTNLPSLPSQQDIAEMSRLRQIMEGANLPAVQEPVRAHYSGGSDGVRRPLNEGYVAPPAYSPVGLTGREDVDAMKAILERLNAVNGEDTEVLRETVPTSAPRLPNVASGPYEVAILLKESANGAELRSYDVINASRQPVVEGLVIKEAAQAVAKFLNKGQVLEGKKIQEVLELEEEYNRCRIEASKIKARYQRCVELGESDAANVFKSRHATTRATALAASDQIKSILESIR
jgi:hypothetical protein